MTPRSEFRCAGRNRGHPSKYWPSAKVLDLGDHLEPDTPNAVGDQNWIFIGYSIRLDRMVLYKECTRHMYDREGEQRFPLFTLVWREIRGGNEH